MVTPVNSDKSMTPVSERTTQAKRGMAEEQVKNRLSDSPVEEKTAEVSAADVNNARELYQLETNRLASASSRIETPEEARSLLNRIMEQFSASPETAFKMQSGGSNSLLGNLLSTTPG